MKQEYEIIPQIEGIFKVINLTNGEIYYIDIHKPYCSCERFKYNKTNKKGIKKVCKHLIDCKGIGSDTSHKDLYDLSPIKQQYLKSLLPNTNRDEWVFTKQNITKNH